MTLWDRLRALLRREAADAKEIAADLQQRADAELTRREQSLAATPEERLQATLEEIRATDDAFEDLKTDLTGDGDGDGAAS